jgi:hypothetical protein
MWLALGEDGQWFCVTEARRGFTWASHDEAQVIADALERAEGWPLEVVEGIE